MTKSTYIDQVKEFHVTFEHPILLAPQIPDKKRCELRYNLIKEELQEFKDACDAGDLVGIADAFADLQYVLSGSIIEFGMAEKFDSLFSEVHRSNMSKACTNEAEAFETIDKAQDSTGESHHCVCRGENFFVYRTRDMKTVKSINYSPANLKALL